MKTQTKIIKTMVKNDENEARKIAAERLNTSPRNLKTMHEAKTFVFEKIR